MSALRELQGRMAGMIRSGDVAAVSTMLGGSETERRAGLVIYRNNVMSSLTAALAETYPVIERLVGTEFFRACAHEYIRRYPTSDPVLAHYGASFAQFLRNFEPARPHEYLPDVAALEFAWLSAYHAPDVAPIDMSALQKLAPEQMASIRLIFHPSLHLLSSMFPVETIWRANRPETLSDENIDLAAGPHYVAVARPRRRVDVSVLPAASFYFLKSLKQGEDLTAAVDAALARDESFNVTAVLTDLFNRFLITDFAISDRG